MKRICAVLLAVSCLCLLGAASAGQDLVVIEFDLYPSAFEPDDFCMQVPEWLLDQLAEHSPYSCRAVVLTRSRLQSQRIVGNDLSLTADAIKKVFQKEEFAYLVIGSITADIFTGAVTVTASLVDSSGSVVESGTVVSPSIEETQIHMRDLCFALLDMEPLTGNAPPVAKINVRTQVSEQVPGASSITTYRNEIITLDSSASYDIDGDIERVEWDLNADGTIDEYQPTIQCDSLSDKPGSHVVLLRVIDGYGAIDEERIELRVLEDDIQDAAQDTNVRPQAILTILGSDGFELNRPAYRNEELTLQSTESYDPDGRIASITWDLNMDGEPDHVASEFKTRTLSESSGSRTIELCVTDDLGVTECTERTIEVSDRTYDEQHASRNLAPVIYIDVQRETAMQKLTGSPYVVFLSEAVTLDCASSYDPDGSIQQWTWTVEGESSPIGYRSSLRAPDLTAYPGQRTIMLEVTDNDGAVTHKSIVLTILDYSADQRAERNVQDNVMPVLRRIIMTTMGIALIAGVGYLIWYFGW